MTGKNHLGTTDELISFMKSMNDQLQKHKNEKTSMRNYSFIQTMKNNIPEINKRIEQIKVLTDKLNSFDEFNDDDRQNMYSEINKQFTHIANYCLMGWLKSQ